MFFEPHNYTHGWKAVFAAQILAPRFGGLEAVTNALDFFQRLGKQVPFFRWSLSYMSEEKQDVLCQSVVYYLL